MASSKQSKLEEDIEKQFQKEKVADEEKKQLYLVCIKIEIAFEVYKNNWSKLNENGMLRKS